jgi:hypothetical protein
MNPTHRVAELLIRCGESDSVLPPTALFNEGWMLRLVIDWSAHHRSAIPELTFDDGSRWYSEALLASRFRPRHRGDVGGEGFTHADGVIGHFRLRPGGRGDIELLPNARQLVIVEAKMASGFSAGTTRAPQFNQAARNVACIANLLSSAGLEPSAVERIGFVLMAPAARIAEGVFASALDRRALCAAVQQRAAAFDADAAEWCRTSFDPLAQRCSLVALSWESALSQIEAVDSESGERLRRFYEKCLLYNPFQQTRPLRVSGR